MVTFRFYLVSVVGFFLALAVGVVVGSVLDDGISKGLQERLDRVESNLDETGQVIDEKNERLSEQDRFAAAVAPFAVEHRLEDTSSLVVAEPGLPAEAVEAAAGELRNAGSSVQGVVWLEEAWALEDPDDLARFEQIAGESGVDPGQLRAGVLGGVLAAYAVAPEEGSGAEGEEAESSSAGEGAEGSDETQNPEEPSDPGEPLDFFSSPILTRLQEEGFLRLVQLGGGEAVQGGSQPLVVAVTGTDSRLPEPGVAATEVASAAGALRIPSVLAGVHDRRTADSDRGSLLPAASDTGGAPYSTVDDLELVAGRVATVLALEQGREGVVGRYGYGPDVDGVLPSWPGK